MEYLSTRSLRIIRRFWKRIRVQSTKSEFAQSIVQLTRNSAWICKNQLKWFRLTNQNIFKKNRLKYSIEEWEREAGGERIILSSKELEEIVGVLQGGE